MLAGGAGYFTSSMESPASANGVDVAQYIQLGMLP